MIGNKGIALGGGEAKGARKKREWTRAESRHKNTAPPAKNAES